mmetsp:Transcript_96403/g.244953  ORF Transcript_96403/g.244953 Transcript_96403/m.244953 type:complete len:266 (-) Transcript_96403:567-1364(-)
MEPPDLTQEERPEILFVELLLLLEVQRHLAWGGRFQLLVSHLLEKRMLESLRHSDALRWIEDQHLLEQVAAGGVHGAEPSFHAGARFLPKAFHVGLGIVSLGGFDVLRRRCADQGVDHAELIPRALGVILGVVLVSFVRRKRKAGVTGEKGASVLVLLTLQHAQKLGVDATHGPHVDGLRVIFLQKDELGGTVPPCHNMAREVALLAELLRIARIKHPGSRFATHSASEAEVADFHATILVDQAVRRLQVPVPDARRVEVVEADE